MLRKAWSVDFINIKKGDQVMSADVIFMGWDRAVPGREAAVAAQFQEVLQYLGELQQAGTIESFQPVLLSPHGGDLNGFILIQGESTKLDALAASREWGAHVTRGGLNLQGLGVVRGATGELLMEWMTGWTEAIPT
jgi:hypothetical protein